MTSSARARGLFRSLIVLVVGAALVSAAIRFGRTTAAPAAAAGQPRPAATHRDGEGVVCFGTVDLEHGVASLDPLQPGRVAEVLVREGQEVPKGAELLRLEDGAARLRLDEATAAVELVQLQ